MGVRLLEGLNLSQYTQVPYNTWVDRLGITTSDSVAGLTPIATNGASKLIVAMSSPLGTPLCNVYILCWDERGNPITGLSLSLSIQEPTPDGYSVSSVMLVLSQVSNSSNYTINPGLLNMVLPTLDISNVFGINIVVGLSEGSNAVNLHYKLV